MSIPARDAGVQALKNGDPKGALQHLAEAVRQNPVDPQAYAYLGTAYGQLNMPEQAAQCLERAVALAPQSAALQFNFGTALERTGKRDEAVTAYRRALAVDASYTRAQQALIRLGQHGTPAAPAVPAYPPHAEVTQASAAPSPYGQPPPSYAPAPNPYGAPPAAYSQEPTLGYNQEPTLYGAAAQAAAPTVYGAPAGGLQPMGDWTPPEPQGGGGLADYQSAPRRPAVTASSYTPEAGSAVMATVENPGSSLPRSWMLGHCYLSGMTLGAWWGILGGIMVFLDAMLSKTSARFSADAGLVFMEALMVVAIGMLVYGVAGIFGGMTDDPEQTCHNLGVVIGILTSVLLIPMLVAVPLAGIAALIATVIVSRLFGKALGGRINEMQANVFVVTSAGDVALVRGR